MAEASPRVDASLSLREKTALAPLAKGLRCIHKYWKVAPQLFDPPNPSWKAKLFHSLIGSKKTCVVNESGCVVNESGCVV
ncbi:hypothetical protein, partial [uncultured Nostoc sp.]|uniref:hypothetical protein n=1 Tax=uncultured Nostoc sp. TaxID=340711 RepID=UPI0035CA4006